MSNSSHYDFPHAKTRAQAGQAVTLAAIAVLVLNALAQQLAAGAIHWLFLLIQCVPLLVFVPGIRANYHRTYSWLCFVVLFYFIVGVTNVMSPLADSFGWIQLVASVCLFIAAMMTSRWLQQASVHNLPKPDPVESN